MNRQSRTLVVVFVALAAAAHCQLRRLQSHFENPRPRG